MKTYLLKVLLPGVIVAATLAYAASVGAEAPPPASPSATPPAAQAAPMGDHRGHHAVRAKHRPDSVGPARCHRKDV